ncbi:MAG: hypothetical protein F4X54_09550 [Chloroflexi bacterium]|nr:hypothetical protein [Chloroflexota bacterium]MYB84961.1 hypothetical protein [Chloroflexota bacterium]
MSMEENKQPSEQPADAAGLVRRLTRPEVLGEMVLLAIVGIMFATMLWESQDWTTASALMPRIAIGIGAPLWFIRVIGLVRYALGTQPERYRGVRREEESSGQIMDLGFYMGEDQRAALVRFLSITGMLLILLAGIWLVGWHISLPVWTFAYLLIFAKVKVWQAALGGIFFLAVIIGVYGALFDTLWNDPVLFRMLR